MLSYGSVTSARARRDGMDDTSGMCNGIFGFAFEEGEEREEGEGGGGPVSCHLQNEPEGRRMSSDTVTYGAQHNETGSSP